ncbi:hypothetical protein [Phenylobacterium sp. J367]|uniref:hypothetical protein n=1 Tax=Phenylobacterium sp. J367 TaxID=2898435 RepID=UPI002150DA04|nr:hypothetical protein [Phenylobacterium sp. J367]MCR5880633.1 hypothetical protein [Phenylobacterium sp. J367]
MLTDLGEVRQLLRGQAVQSALPQEARPLHRHARALGQGRGQGVDQLGGVRRAGAQGDPRHRRLLLVGGQQGDHVAGRRPLRAIEQDVRAADVVVDRQNVAEPGQHAALGVGLEAPVAPPAADQRRGLGALAFRAPGGRQGDRALGGGGLAASEPVDDLAGALARGLDQLLGGLVPARFARPAGQLAPGVVRLVEGQRLAVGVDQRPGGRLPGQRIMDLGDGRPGAGHIGLAGRIDRAAEVGGVGVGERPAHGLVARHRPGSLGRGLGDQVAQGVFPLRLGAGQRPRQQDDTRQQKRFTDLGVQLSPPDRNVTSRLRVAPATRYCPANSERRLTSASFTAFCRPCPTLCSGASFRRL